MPGRHHSGGDAAGGRGLGGVHVGLLLGLDDVLLVSDPLVAEPVIDLARREGNSECQSFGT